MTASESIRWWIHSILLWLAIGFSAAVVGPSQLIMPAISSFLFLGAIINALIAAFTRQDFNEDTLTRWDVAAALYLLSTLLLPFIDRSVFAVK